MAASCLCSEVALRNGELALRDEIRQSWQRSQMCGLARTSPLTVLQDDVDRDSRLIRAAEPVLNRLMLDLDGTEVAILLADADCRVVDVRGATRAIYSRLGNFGVDIGVRCSGEENGTSSVGTARELGRGISIRGGEHFKLLYERFTCYGHPVINPRTQRIEGVISLTTTIEHENPLYPAVIRSIVPDIEERLHADSSLADLRLLSQFRQAANRGRAVIAAGHGYVLSSQPALDLLQPEDYAAVLTWAQKAGTGTPADSDTADHPATGHRLSLSSGTTVRLDLKHDHEAGKIVALTPDAQQATAPDSQDGTRTGRPLLVVGEPGSGRTTAARQATGAERRIEVDIAEAGDGLDALLAGSLTGALTQPGESVIIENVQLLTEESTLRLAGLLKSTPRRVVLTSTPAPRQAGTLASLLAAGVQREDLVPLRRRRPEIPSIAQQMLAEIAPDRGMRLTPLALRTLAADDWPGNLAELHGVIAAMAARRTVGDLTPKDIPAAYRGPTRLVSPRQQAEADAITSALHAAGGNKARAAAQLGISRATLYNRLRALGISL